MIEICSYEKCTGCGLCESICPQNCISMDYGIHGFLVPQIDKTRCKECNLCVKNCPARELMEGNYPIEAYMAWSKNENVRKKSASGGVAYEMYSMIIEKMNGIGVGTCLDENMQLGFHVFKDTEDLHKTQGSKYFQSNTKTIYKRIKEYNELKSPVLFIGTPCQANAARKFLGEKENIYYVDLVCHGVPSQKFVNEYNEFLTKKIKKNATAMSFRGENNYDYTLYDKEKIIYRKSCTKDDFFVGFLKGLFYRESCYSCPYANEHRRADITIGDFWGGEELLTQEETQKGVSAILVNTQKGKKLIEKLEEDLVIKQVDVKKVIDGNEQLQRPSNKHKNTERFKKIYQKHGFVQAVKKSLRRERFFQKEEWISAHAVRAIEILLKKQAR